MVEWKTIVGESGVRDRVWTLFFCLGFHYIQNQANSDSKDEERPVGVVVELMIKGGSPRFVFLLFYEYKSGDPHWAVSGFPLVPIGKIKSSLFWYQSQKRKRNGGWKQGFDPILATLFPSLDKHAGSKWWEMRDERWEMSRKGKEAQNCNMQMSFFFKLTRKSLFESGTGFFCLKFLFQKIHPVFCF